MNVLWLAPNFNHYKARFLDHLAQDKAISLTILSGSGRKQMGDQEIDNEWSFEYIRVNVPKKEYGKSKIVKDKLKTIYGNYNWIMIPAEKKNLPLFLYALKLRKQNPNVRLFSYNHTRLKSKNAVLGFLDNRISRYFNDKLDRVIFYSEDACKRAVELNLIKSKKAFWANNTIDNTEIEKHYTFQLPPKSENRILFIGRLISSKRVNDLISCYNALRLDFQNMKLEIIGSGPEDAIVKNISEKNADVKWHGTLVDESKIAPIMQRASIVVVPGLSGLSINHAFAYGRPYITLIADKHGPEINYLDHGKNGYILSNNDEIVTKISELLSNRQKLENFCLSANEKGKQLSVQNWVQQIKTSLIHE
ncbi:glycosyltransferase family 4 protein [Winogradskyella sp.]|uniref:glycosyltransferase family 4 protein n=1 Tax=Winogradskyella sp. TaxID=1883156 RepID=UPI0035194F28